MTGLSEQYNYSFPAGLIAQTPAHPRDSARLLVYNQSADAVAMTTFRELPKWLPANAVLIVNNSKVIPARLRAVRDSGGAVEVFYLRHNNQAITALVNRKLTIGEKISLAPDVYFTVQKKAGKYSTLIPSFPMTDIFAVLDRFGTTPIPPYIKHSSLSEARLKEEYQTVFADQPGSVAAPTASLHFTPALLEAIKRAGHDILAVTLHVNLGTFAPLTAGQLASGRLHAEHYAIDPQTAALLNKAKQAGRPMIAVGTTTVRTLESASNDRGKLEYLNGVTDLFIRPGYSFKFIDNIITNFHVPTSSLLMLVAAFIGREKLLELYATAINAQFRLFSFGDGMMIVKQQKSAPFQERILRN